MKVESFTENDIREAAELAYPVWGVGHADSGRGEKFGLLMCEYIVRYGWYGAPYAYKMVDDNGKMAACILAGDHTKDNGYDKWLDGLIHRIIMVTTPTTALREWLHSSPMNGKRMHMNI